MPPPSPRRDTSRYAHVRARPRIACVFVYLLQSPRERERVAAKIEDLARVYVSASVREPPRLSWEVERTTW